MGREKNHQQYSQPDRAAVRAQVKQGDGWQTGEMQIHSDLKSPSKMSILPHRFDVSHIPSIPPREPHTEGDSF